MAGSNPTRAHPGQGRALVVPRASSDGWAAMATLPEATAVSKGDKLLLGRLPDTHVAGWPPGCPLQQIIWGSVGGKRNEGDLGTAPQSGWHCCSCAVLRAVIV